MFEGRLELPEVNMLDARTTQLSATVQVLETNLVLLGAQVGAFQQASPAQHSSSAASAGVAEAFPATADGVARDMGGTGWPLRGMRATEPVYHDMSGVGGQPLFGGGAGSMPT